MSYITKINSILIDNAEDLDIVMSIYNFLEYSDNYFTRSGSLWNYLFIYLLYLTLVYKIVENNLTNKYQNYGDKIDDVHGDASEGTGFDNYHKIAVRDHVRVSKFWRTWRTWCTWANTKKHISGVIPFT